MFHCSVQQSCHFTLLMFWLLRDKCLLCLLVSADERYQQAEAPEMHFVWHKATDQYVFSVFAFSSNSVYIQIYFAFKSLPFSQIFTVLNKLTFYTRNTKKKDF